MFSAAVSSDGRNKGFRDQSFWQKKLIECVYLPYLPSS